MATRTAIVYAGFTDEVSVTMTDEPRGTWGPPYVSETPVVRRLLGDLGAPRWRILRSHGALMHPFAASVAIASIVTGRNVRNIDQDTGNRLPRGSRPYDLDEILSWLDDEEEDHGPT